MVKTLYELRGGDHQRFSPYAWRSRLAIAHKGLDVASAPTRFGEIKQACGGASKTVPILDDDGTIVSDSWKIADYLEETYPDNPIFNCEVSKAHCRFIDNWATAIVLMGAFPMIAIDIWERLDPADQDYFRATREQRLGKPLEEAAEGRDEKVKSYRGTLAPLRMTLTAQPYIGGDKPSYADHAVMGTLMLPRVMSPFELLEEDDPIHAWRERCLDLYDGLARSEAAAS